MKLIVAIILKSLYVFIYAGFKPKSIMPSTKPFLGAFVAKETYDKVEQVRGQTPRSRIIENALIQFLNGQMANKEEASGERVIKA